MRRVIVTKKNENSFDWSRSSATDLLRTIDELLHDKGLELVIGDDGTSDYPLRIDKCKVDEEYDPERARLVLYGRGRGMFDQFEI